MMKNYLLMLAIIMVAMCSVSFVSCGGDDDEIEQTKNKNSQDPEGTIVLNMNSGSSDNYYSIGELGEIHIDEANNFKGNSYKVQFVSVGPVSGLKEITKIPVTGWAESAAVVPGTGYIMRSGFSFARIYVVDNLSSPIAEGFVYTSGATIKYQTNFNGADETIKLSKESITVDGSGGREYILFDNKSLVRFTEESSEEWCYAHQNDYNSLYVHVFPNDKMISRTATITLTTAYNRKTTINVTQYGKSAN